MSWAPNSWRQYPIKQQPDYDDPQAVTRALERVRGLPSLVALGEIEALKAKLAMAARGEAFLLQGGDCAERFVDCNRVVIESKLKVLLQMSLAITWGAKMPCIRVGRMAGQYAKPRSKATEEIDGQTIPSYRGDHVNGIERTLAARRPDPARLVHAYFHSASTLNYVRALLHSGFADLHHPHHWDLGFFRDPAERAAYQEMVGNLLDALDFFQSTGTSGHHAFKTAEVYSSHEGLLLNYEEAQTEVRGAGDWYNFGAHMLWIGDRTRQLEDAHVEYFRGIGNPIGIKISPSITADELLDLLNRLDPEHEPGRITLISRMGAAQVEQSLPPLVEAVRGANRTVLWSCDPMHGNGMLTREGTKTRRLDDISHELLQTFQIHQSLGSLLGGVHVELTGEDVTECIGGPQQLDENDLHRSYETYCDPRLNYAQSLELAFLIAEQLKQRLGSRRVFSESVT